MKKREKLKVQRMYCNQYPWSGVNEMDKNTLNL